MSEEEKHIDVKDVAVQVSSPAEVDYQEGWMNSEEKEIISK